MNLKERVLAMFGYRPHDSARDRIDLMEERIVERIARKHNTTPAEVRAEARRREQYLRLKVRQARRQ